MNITFKNINGAYEASPKYFNNETMKNESIFTIVKSLSEYDVMKKGIKVASFKKQSEAKKHIEDIYLHQIVVSEEEQGFVDGGGWSGGVCITGDGKGFEWYKDENGNHIYK